MSAALPQRHIVFCLCPGMPLLCIASAIEVLRHANRFHGSACYRWTLIGEHGRPVPDSNGLMWQPLPVTDDADPPDLAFIVAGHDASRLRQPRLCDWLSRQAQAGHRIGGISSGAFLLAASGLLDHCLATTHWEDFESFCTLFPRVRARYQRFAIDRQRLTCAGGTATLDMFIEIVRQDLGNEIALGISRQMLLQEQSILLPGNLASRPAGRYCSAPVHRALNLIEAGVGQPITVESLAQRVGVSRRELLRLFRRELRDTPSNILAQRRLDRARSLILNTRLGMAMIAEAVGFSSQSHLTSRYRSRFGVTPAQQRRDYQSARDRLPLSRRDFLDW